MTAPRLCWAGGLRIAAVLGVLAGLAVLTGPVTPRAVAGEPGVTPFVRVRIDQVTPDVVTTTSPPVVTVSGMVTNIGDRPVRDVMVRLEHAGPVTASAGLRTSLDGDTDQYQAAADFLTVAPELQRGQEVGFTLSAPLRALTKQSLGVEKPGIYPVLVNVNGTPDYGAPARLDNARFLLPVVGVPPDRADDLGSAVAPDTSKPVGITMLWPLADRPRLAPGVPGGTIPVRLVDDDLATSLASGGRLDILLAAAEVATSHDVDPDGAVGRALCLAVDPDLLVTVNAMTAGYVVSDSPDGPAQLPGTPTHPGTGQATATEWLNRLRALAHRTCVAPLPYAQADLDALQRVNDPGLSNTALTSVNSIVDKILDVPSTRGATLMPDGRLTGRAVKLLGANQTTVAVTAADLSAGDAQGSSETSVDTAPRRVSPQVVAAPFDPAVGAALAGAGVNPEVPTYLDSSLTVRLAHDSVTARRQDALGSMFWHALRHDDTPRTQLLVPPATWNLQADDAQVILTALTTSIRSGLAVPRPLPAVIGEATQAAQTGGPPANQVSADGSTRGQFNDDVTGAITGQVGRLWGLTSALMTDDRTGLTGVQYTAPLREDMLRALSQSEPPDSRNGLAQQRLAVVGKTINDLFGAVTIVNPGGSYTLATEHSPLPLALHNGLAVPIRVRVHVDAPPGMNVTDVGVIELPPGYLPLRIPIEVNFTQRVAVDVTLRTADGMRLGEPVRLSVHSNAYGKVLFAITLSAAAVLVLLAGRRLWHRFRGQPDRADLDRPDPPDARHAAQPDLADPRVEQEHRV
ncbi:hypothetical protein LIX17_24950 [Mycobacterium avium subsp. hominissuis]|uniref:Secreted protein n=8 Tax=Mycobacterium avium complex (MAC) TaxID=120793 RepID=A0A2A3L7H7_MYCAV|nr:MULTISPECIES: hypothetical protein [Mycobacterium avium complex (MAC)]APA78371.1 hypothetical protein KV38_24280 [Mycobacterium avium subsp. hominissuis]APT13373.1 hypothetical protein BS641_26390 [Mycobacterium avium subsp. hominissuis]AXO25376.1 hypothetical protein DFS55_24510 [Mycobacterium avium subsp. hominissuis]KDP00818.1 hypothetical protein MAV100_24995 [Mycobacterium avium subsp. hominissuis 100]MBZ4502165.1 hypothetical protein [Mycobacterium avium subsp. hominissuis]